MEDVSSLVSDKLTAEQIERYIDILVNSETRNCGASFSYDEKSNVLLDELYDLIREISPISQNGAREIWLCAKRGTIEDFANAYGSFEDNKDSGLVDTYKDYVEYWESEFPNEYIWYRLVILDDKSIDYQGIFIDGKNVIERDGRRPNDLKPVASVLQFVEWLTGSVRLVIKAIKDGSYNAMVARRLPYRQRVGVISRANLWALYPDVKEGFFAEISDEDVQEFLASDPGRIADGLEIHSMTAAKFYLFCSLGYAANNYAVQGLTPREQYYRYSDGRDDGLGEIPMASEEAFSDWMKNRERGGHPWEVCRGGDSTHISLYVDERENGKGYYLAVAGDSTVRCVEAIKFYLALKRANLPVVLCDSDLLKQRLTGTELVGIVPDGVMPRYCQSWFPGEDISSFMNLSYCDDEAIREIALAEWRPLKAVTLLSDPVNIK